ncbi:MAG: hypothetical protein CMJ68_16670 [Planctomycetaceae bacterium]|jgi:hypothetical protein|nr:hypothetical protein [Planctomycetaceae bacterium]
MNHPRTCPLCSGGLKAGSVDEVSRWLCEGCGAEWVETDTPSQADETTGTKLADSVASVGRYLFYGLSLPERAVRSSIGLAAGAARETAELLVPRAFQDSRTYGIVVRNSLRFLATDVGGVTSPTTEDEEPAVEGYLARKAVGNFVDMAGWATLSCSPVWLMAVVSDVAYGARSYTRELASELQQKGLIAKDSTINSVDDLLGAIQGATGEAAGLFDTPPLSVADLKATLEATRDALDDADITAMIPESELETLWEEMKQLAGEEDVGLLGVSGAVTMLTLQKVGTVGHGALTGIQVVGGLLNRQVIGHYVESLSTIREQGFYNTLRETAEPYIDAVWSNFSPDRDTWTESLLSGRAIGQGFNAVAGWFGGGEENPDEATTGDEDDRGTDKEGKDP